MTRRRLSTNKAGARPGFFFLALTLAAVVLGTAPALAQETSTLARNRYRNGEETLRAFAPISRAVRDSIVKLNVNGDTAALGVVVDTGLALTKASELKPGKLTCWLASEREVAAEVLASDEELDLALVRVHARGIKPVAWAATPAVLGQWAVSPGIALTPQAVGIVSATPRRIRPPRAYIGVEFDGGTSKPVVGSVMEGLGAERAGLKHGDVIVAVNGDRVADREQVVERLREFSQGQKVRIAVQRGQEEFEAEISMMVPTGGAADASRSEGRNRRITGELSQRSEGFEKVIEHDTVLQPWLCGGPLMNLDGKAIGLNIARAGRVSTYALPAAVVQKALEKLRKKAGR